MPSNGEGGNNGEGDDVEYAPKQIVISISNENYCYRSSEFEPLPELYSDFQTFQNTLNPSPECSKRILCDFCGFTVPEHSAGCPVLEVRLKINPDHAEKNIRETVKKITKNIENGSETENKKDQKKNLPWIKINEPDVSTKPESFPDNTILTYIEDDELLEDNSDSLEGEEDDPEFDPDLFLWKKSSIANNEPDFSSASLEITIDPQEDNNNNNDRNCNLSQLGSLEQTQKDISQKKLYKYQKDYLSKEAELEGEDPLERKDKEIQRLQETTIRLEQENDDLAHELVTSKIALRSELDQAEDKAEILNKELLATKSQLTEAEDEKKQWELEANQVKEMCRRELDRLDTEIKRSNTIITDYKQICGQLSERLEKQQTLAQASVKKYKDQMESCNSCSVAMEAIEAASADDETLSDQRTQTPSKVDNKRKTDKENEMQQQLQELEMELAQTKLALVESECRTQDLMHQLNAALSEISSIKSTWYHKTFTSIKRPESFKAKPGGVSPPGSTQGGGGTPHSLSADSIKRTFSSSSVESGGTAANSTTQS